jgi:hypothetical protein
MVYMENAAAIHIEKDRNCRLPIAIPNDGQMQPPRALFPARSPTTHPYPSALDPTFARSVGNGEPSGGKTLRSLLYVTRIVNGESVGGLEHTHHIPRGWLPLTGRSL